MKKPFILDANGTMRPADKYEAPMLMADKAPVGFHVMIKPAGAACNLDCTYCFYLSKAGLPDGPGVSRMSDETLALLIKSYIRDVTAAQVVFTWQGGEPTLCGLPFFKKAVSLQKQYAKPGQVILNDLQTNGTLIDEKWCRFLKKNDFLVGLSIDGPENLHNANRRSKNGSPTFKKVVRAAELLKRFGVPFNAMTSVNRKNAAFPLKVYQFLTKELGANCIQFTPVVEPEDFEQTAPRLWNETGQPGKEACPSHHGQGEPMVTEWSVDPQAWGNFLCTIFDEWFARDLGRVMVNQFETLVSQHLGLGPQMCIYGETCGRAVAVEHDGRVYSCDHFVYPRHEIGSIHENRLRDIVLFRGQVRFGYAKAETLPAYCRACEYLSDCRGECPKNRVCHTPDGEPGLNYLCPGLKSFYAHALPRIEHIIERLRQSKSEMINDLNLHP
nr:anaerobic sulfatase maturase [uncultured Desulfobacter sp.]